MNRLDRSAIYDVRMIIDEFTANANRIVELRKDVQNLTLGEREDVVIKLYLESEMDEVDIAEKLDMTTVEVVRILQSNGIY